MNEKIKAILTKYDLLDNNEIGVNFDYTDEIQNDVLIISDDLSDVNMITFLACCNDLNDTITDTIYFYYKCDEFLYIATKNAIDLFT